MARRLLLVILLLAFVAASAPAADKLSSSTSADALRKSIIDGVDDVQMNFGPVGFPTLGPNPQPVGDTAGCTYWDYFQNGSMGRMISWDAQATSYVHFMWIDRATAGGSRYIHKNDRASAGTGAWAGGSGLTGGTVVSNINGGYSELVVNRVNGYGVATYHEGTSALLYQTKVGTQVGSQTGAYSLQICPGPPTPTSRINCQGIQTGNYESNSTYLWPKVACQRTLAGKDVYHVVASESPPDAADNAEIQSIVYYRWQDNKLDHDGDGIAEHTDSCGTLIDSTHTVNPIVCADPNSDRVAIVYLKTIYYDTLDTRMSGCKNSQLENDVYYVESTNAGVTWGAPVNVTDYSNGGTKTWNQMPYMAWADVNAIYDNSNKLHIVWPCMFNDVNESDPCAVYFQSMMWHWSSASAPKTNIVVAFDASIPALFQAGGFGAFNAAVAKPTMSICNVGGTDILYIAFTRYGAHVQQDNTNANGDLSDSPDLAANGDIFITASSDGGMTWGPDGSLPAYDMLTTAGQGRTLGPVKQGSAVNVTNTWSNITISHDTITITPCAAGNCHSENWASMPAYCANNIHLFFEDDNDAGPGIRGEDDDGDETNNALMYYKMPCFAPEPVFLYSYAPDSQFVAIAPGNSTPADNCNVPKTETFNITLRNRGNIPINYTVTDNLAMLTVAPTSGTVTAGVSYIDTLVATVGPHNTPGVYTGTISIALSSTAGSANLTIPVTVLVACKYFPPESKILSTFCWSVGVWNVPRAGGEEPDSTSNMFWFIEGVHPLYDEGLIISLDNDPSQTWFSIFDGSEYGAGFAGLDSVTTLTTGTYEYAHGKFADPIDSCIIGEIEYYVPIHPDTCVMIERVKICNECAGTVVLNIGEGTDWDIEDGDGNENTWKNRSGSDVALHMVYQYGVVGVPYEDYAGGAALCHDNPGAIVLENDKWVSPHSGYVPTDIGNLIATHTGLTVSHPDSIEDLSTMEVVAQNVSLAHGECYTFCKVKASSITGVSDLLSLIAKGKNWIKANGLDCPGCEGGPGCAPGDANGAGDPPVDIDDIVYLINFVFGGGPEPVGALCCGDANAAGDPPVDIDDIVYLINFVFGGGPAPLPAC